MSYDFNSRTGPCDHYQTLERYVVSQDLHTLVYAGDTALFMRAPLGNSSMLRLYISGKLVPSNSYQILRDTTLNELDTETFYKIVFRKAIRLITPLIEVSYFTRQPYCLKCSGTGQLEDWKLQNGHFKRIGGTDKLVQTCLKYILASECAFYPTLTCSIKTYIGRKFGVSVTEADINNAVISSLQNLKSNQNAQKRIQIMDSTELLNDLVSCTVEEDPADPTIVHVALQISSFGAVVPPLKLTLQTNVSNA